ncbi:MAG: glycosyltransferase, partial [Shewanella sp.]
MHIALVVDALDAGGIARVASLLANGFLAQGHQVTIYDLLHRGCIYPLSAGVRHWCSARNRYENNIQHAIEHINSSEYTVVMLLSMGRLSVYFAWFSYLQRLRIPLICCEHTAFAHHAPWVKILKKLTYRRYRSVALLTDIDKLALKNYCQHNCVIYNPSPFTPDAKQLAQYRIVKQQTSPSILAIGHYVAGKGFKRLINLWAKLLRVAPECTWQLNIVGDGPEKSALTAQIAALNLTGNVKLLPPTTDIATYYQMASIYVSTSHYEGLPMT